MYISDYEQLLSIIGQKIRNLRASGTNERYVVAVDGNCGSGKTTGVRMIAESLGCSVIQMDDFYLTPAMRTKNRRSEPGGNVNYERFKEEVLPFIKSREPFSYRKYDAPSNRFVGDIEIASSELVIVEGAYALRPDLRAEYDLSVFSKASYELQVTRLAAREGQYVEEYKNIWIPLENAYHEFFDLEKNVDIVINVG